MKLTHASTGRAAPQAVFTLVNDMLNIVKDICPSSEPTVLSTELAVGNSSCLTPEQEKQLKEAITAIGGLFDTAIVALEVADKLEKDPIVKHNLETALTVLKAVNQDIVHNLTAIAEGACPTCSNITHVIQESVDIIEETLEKIDPN